MGKILGIGLLAVACSGCALGERPNDPPADNDRDAKIIGRWFSGNQAVSLITFDGREMVTYRCDTSACHKNVYAYRTYLNTLYKDFFRVYQCSADTTGCALVSEWPSGGSERYEVFSGGDSLALSVQSKYGKIR